MKSLFLLLGGNLGDREEYLWLAERSLSAVFGKTGLKSDIYETAAWGVTDQPAFLNQVLTFTTDKPSLEILAQTQAIETELGRVRKERWGARVLDIDLLFYGNTVLISPDLILPHPQLHLRRFTLLPLAQIAPDFSHPVLHKTIKELLNDCPDQLEVNLLQ